MPGTELSVYKADALLLNHISTPLYHNTWFSCLVQKDWLCVYVPMNILCKFIQSSGRPFPLQLLGYVCLVFSDLHNYSFLFVLSMFKFPWMVQKSDVTPCLMAQTCIPPPIEYACFILSLELGITPLESSTVLRTVLYIKHSCPLCVPCTNYCNSTSCPDVWWIGRQSIWAHKHRFNSSYLFRLFLWHFPQLRTAQINPHQNNYCKIEQHLVKQEE